MHLRNQRETGDPISDRTSDKTSNKYIDTLNECLYDVNKNDIHHPGSGQ